MKQFLELSELENVKKKFLQFSKKFNLNCKIKKNNIFILIDESNNIGFDISKKDNRIDAYMWLDKDKENLLYIKEFIKLCNKDLKVSIDIF